MPGRRDEIEDFKTAIDLRSFAAAAFAFELDPKLSSANSAVMRGPDGMKVVIARDRRDGHYTYFAVGDPSDSGSIIDFAQKRGIGSLGQVRKALRPYLGHPADLPPRARFERPLDPIERDVAAVRAAVAGMRSLDAGVHPYLNRRGLSPATLSHPRFAERIRIDDRGNAVFVHMNREGVCGFELKNDGFTGFAKGGVKGAFASTIREDDDALVVAESAIDLLSYAQMFGIDRRRWLSLGGQVSQEQLELLESAAAKMPRVAHVFLAFDNDAGGVALTDKVGPLFDDAERGLIVIRHFPPDEGADWNEVLLARCGPASDPAPGAESPPPPELDVG